MKLLRLSRDAGVHLLKTLGVNGTAQEFATLVEDVKGHALTLTLLGTYLRDAHGGDIRKRDLVKLEEADEESDHPHHAFHVMDAYVNWLEGKPNPRSSGRESAQTSSPGDQSGLTSAATEEAARSRRALAILRLLGLFDRPATADWLTALWSGEAIPGLTGAGQGERRAANKALTRLQDAKLLTVNRDAAGALVSLDAHPLIREYFAVELKRRSGERGSPVISAALARCRYERLACGPPAALRTPLRDHAGRNPAQSRRPPAALPSRGPRLPGGIAGEAAVSIWWRRISRTEGYSVKNLGRSARIWARLFSCSTCRGTNICRSLRR